MSLFKKTTAVFSLAKMEFPHALKFLVRTRLFFLFEQRITFCSQSLLNAANI